MSTINLNSVKSARKSNKECSIANAVKY